jgi:hypothetical protein
MADLPPPETLRKPTGDVVHVNSTQGLNTLSVGGKTYQIIDVGYVCGTTACTVLSEDTCLFDPAPYCTVCATCFHPEGAPPVPVPDYLSCGIPAGLYGILVKFKPPWICHCLKMLGYVSANVNMIQPVGTIPFCGAPSIPPPLHGFNPFPLIAGAAIVGGLALASATLPSGARVSFDADGRGTPFRPGIDGDIDALPVHPAGTLVNFNGCPDEQPSNIKVDSSDTCNNPNNPPNGVILTQIV